MKAVVVSILLLTSVHCFAQDGKSQNKLEQIYLAKARNSPEYKLASSELNEVMQNIALAKKGLAKKTDVVNDYNSKLGIYIGEKQTFE